ncbi:MAG: serine/threonine protein kinase, partial [Alphaproteobacteria bacterium]|nr:serine/threonine protein kinase [Alphaproteobacteria bacterium]
MSSESDPTKSLATWFGGEEDAEDFSSALLSTVQGVLGRYEDRGLLGTGGSSEVRRAYDPALDRTVALKALRPDLPDTGAALSRFAEEARATARLDHPGIV